MEQMLEQQWDQGAQFLMEQGDHFDSKIFLAFLFVFILYYCLFLFIALFV